MNVETQKDLLAAVLLNEKIVVATPDLSSDDSLLGEPEKKKKRSICR